MAIKPRVKDRDPALTCRRILLVINAVGDSAPAKVTEWVDLSIDENGDGDLRKVVAFARAARAGRMLHNEAIAVMRDVVMRRVGDASPSWRGRV